MNASNQEDGPMNDDVFKAMYADMRAAVSAVAEKHYGVGSQHQDEIVGGVIAALGMLLSGLIAAMPAADRRFLTERAVTALYETTTAHDRP